MAARRISLWQGSSWRGFRGLRLALAAIACALLFAPLSALAQGSRVPVEGLPEDLVAPLKPLLAVEDEPQSRFEARRQAERAAQTVLKLLESEGWYQADAEAEAEGLDAFTRSVTVLPGERFTFAGRRIQYADGEPDDETRKILEDMLTPIVVDAPARAEPVLNVGDALLARLKARGYPDAEADPVDALADGDAHTIEVTFQLKPGRRASFGEITLSGAERTRLDFVQTLAPWKPGARYSELQLDEFRTRLSQTGLFETTSVKLAADDQQSVDGMVPRDVTVNVTERDRRTVALGASASTSEGVGVEGQWELRNLRGRGETVTVTAQVATLERRVEAAWTRPNVRRYSRDLRVAATIEDFETDAYDQTGGKLSATIEEQFTRRVRGSLGVEASYASIADQRTRALMTDRREIYLLGATASAEYIGVRDVLDPANGVRARLSLEPGITFGDDRIAFTRMSGEASLYMPIGSEKLVGALRGKLGAIVGPNGAPPDKLFFAGGGGSVRGYEYQSLSPRDATNTPVGGRSLIEASAELRWRASERFGYVAFIDAGAAGDNIDPPIADMRAGAGLGLRYYAGFGPLRFDIATPLNKREGDSDVQVYISIGQAF
ncbi:MAG: autotransporter assembly complex family protein [Hyphomonadaceae bacterium]